MIGNKSLVFRMKKIILPFFTSPKRTKNYNYRRKYDLIYMIEKYSKASVNYGDWFIENINPCGDKDAIEFIDLDRLCLADKSGYGSKFRDIYVLDQQVGNMIHMQHNPKDTKLVFSTKIAEDKQLNLENNSVDIVYSSTLLSSFHNCKKFNFLAESLRVLKNDGIFYLKYVSEDYYDCVYQLFEEYLLLVDSTFEIRQFSGMNTNKVCQYLDSLFSEVIVENLNGDWWITDVDDLIGYLLTEREFNHLKPVISTLGLSKFRNFLLNKINEEGGILIKRQLNVIVCKNKYNLKLAV